MMRQILIASIFLVTLVAGQDVDVPTDLFLDETTPMSSEEEFPEDETTNENLPEEIIPETTTLKKSEDLIRRPETTTVSSNDDRKGSWIESPNRNDLKSDNLIDATHPLYLYPQSPIYPNYPNYDPNCNNNNQYPPQTLIPVPVPPIFDSSTDQPVVEESLQCPIGFVQNGTVCMPLNSNNCPTGYVWKDETCSLSQSVCPLNFDYDGTSCVERQICPPNHIWKDGRCMQPEPQCPQGWKWNGYRCEVARIQCQPGSILIGNECITESITCPNGFSLVNGKCIKPPAICPPGYELKSSGFCSQISVKCPPGFVMINGQCQKTTVSCPPGTQQIGNQCFTIPPPSTQAPTTTTTTYKPPFDVNITPSPPSTDDSPKFPPVFPPTSICPEGFIYHNGQCYRCPLGYTLCNGICLRNIVPCGQYPLPPQPPPNPQYPNYPSYPNYPIIPHPPPNINININISRPYVPPPSAPSAGGKPYNIINNIEPINNTIYNINNITHPVTLNNVNENNVYIYTDTQCADGSIRATVVRNNETITGCIDESGNQVQSTTQKQSATESPKDDHDKESIEDDSENERCCEIITPRQCKKRFTDQWICTHRRYRYCGKFCISDRLYMRPPVTTWSNQILTVAPPPNPTYQRPCYGRECPPVDCTGCMDGSFNCSPQCFTYPCSGSACTYVDQEDFCGNVRGQMCE